VRACASTHLRRRLGLFEDMLSSSQIRHVQQLLAVQNVDPVNPMLDHAFTFALSAMSNMPNWSTPITESGLYIETLGDRSSYMISNTCMFCPVMPSRYWLQVLLRV
jgi:hypothetical protein